MRLRAACGRLLLAAFLAVAAGGGAGAQEARALFAGLQTDSDDPIEVEADSLEVSESGATRQTRFNGNVVVRRGDVLIRAAMLTLLSPVNPAEGAGAFGQDFFDRIEASGEVTINSGEQTARGDEAVIDMRSRTITMTGRVVLTDGANVLSGERLTVDLDSGRARVETPGGDGRIRGIFTPGAVSGRGQ